jgi:hypothetical protein
MTSPRTIARMKRVAIPLGIAGSLALVACPIAAGKQKPNPIGGQIFALEQTTRLVTGQPTSLEVACPTGKKAIAGGFSAIGVTTFDPATGVRRIADLAVVYESRRATPSSWRTSAVKVHNPASGPVPFPPGSFDLRTITYCRKFKSGVREVGSAGPNVSGTSAISTATASCPRNRFPISGGFSTSPAGPGFNYPSLYESFPIGRRGWRTSANPATQGSVTVSSYVYCARGPEPPLRRTGTKSIPGTIGTRACPKRLQASGGGFKLAPDEGAVVGASQAVPGRDAKIVAPGIPYPVGGTWNVNGGNPLGGGTIPTAFSYCS